MLQQYPEICFYFNVNYIPLMFYEGYITYALFYNDFCIYFTYLRLFLGIQKAHIPVK